MCSTTPTTFFRISHSQTRTGTKPSASAVRFAWASRVLFVAIFSAHSATLGPWSTGRTWSCPCQKQPSTQTASRCRGSRRSGLHARSRRTCSRNRYPARWSAWRSMSSGRVLDVGRPDRCRPASVGSKRWRGEVTSLETLRSWLTTESGRGLFLALPAFNRTVFAVGCSCSPQRRRRPPRVESSGEHDQ